MLKFIVFSLLFGANLMITQYLLFSDVFAGTERWEELSLLSSESSPPERSRVDLNSAYNPKVEVISQKPDPKTTMTCSVTLIQLRSEDPILRTPRTIDLLLFSPQKDRNNLGSVVIVPPIYGDTSIDLWNGERFCQSGLQTALIQKWEFYEDSGFDFQVHDRGTLRGVTAIRHVVEYLAESKPGPIGILGTSLGALISSIALSVEPRLTTGVLIVGGGSVAEILSKSQIKNALDLKKRRIQEYKIKSDDEYQERLVDAISLDTLDFAENAEAKKLWMFIATRDTIVPVDTQIKLWEAWKKPQRTEGYLNHVGMVVYTFAFWSYSIRDFFVNNLNF